MLRKVRAMIGPSGKPRAMSIPPLIGRRGALHAAIAFAASASDASNNRSTAQSVPMR